jgi:hypothetical protein
MKSANSDASENRSGTECTSRQKTNRGRNSLRDIENRPARWNTAPKNEATCRNRLPVRQQTGRLAWKRNENLGAPEQEPRRTNKLQKTKMLWQAKKGKRKETNHYGKNENRWTRIPQNQMQQGRTMRTEQHIQNPRNNFSIRNSNKSYNRITDVTALPPSFY